MFRAELVAKADKIVTSDDMYETCRVYCERMRGLSEIERLKVQLEYQALHYMYRLRVKVSQPYDHGNYYEMADEACHYAYERMVRTMYELAKYGVRDEVFDEE